MICEKLAPKNKNHYPVITVNIIYFYINNKYHELQ